LNKQLSNYSSDATRRIGFLRDKLAQYEVLLAKHSLEQGNYADAALHAKAAMENYPQAPAVTEAATITNEAYKMLGIASTVTAGNANVLDKTTMGTTTPDTSMHITNKKPNVVIPFKSSETQAQDNQQTKVKPAATISTATSENTGSAADDKQQDARITTAVQMKEDAQQQNNGIKQAPWLLTQNPSHYTIQLLGTGNERLLVALIKRLNITDKAAYYKNARLDKNWYALTYGTFPSLSEANEAIDQLPADLLKGQPWIRKFSDIHALIGDQ
jgi:septal ring-binding cell division protein DamX